MTSRGSGTRTVVFDHRIFLYQKYGGVSRYYVRLAEHLPTFGFSPFVIAPLHINHHLDDLPKHRVIGIRAPESRNQERFGRNLGERLGPPLVRMLGADIVHETYYSPVRAAPRRSRIVTTIHDMIYELNPDIPRAETYIANKRASLQRADRIICVSENTRRDLLHFYPHLEERTAVVLHGFDPPTSTAADAASLHARPYMLYVGMRWRGYKNFKGLLEAFASSNRLQQEVDLVCVGGGAFNAEELGTMREFGVVDRVIQRDADDAELHRWYSHAHLFVYPSLYEGFGFPPLEAMASSCPVVALRSSSIPEVCGAAVEYAEPGNPASLTAALELVAFSSERRAELAAAGRERTRAFSWEECARRTASIYRGLSG